MNRYNTLPNDFVASAIMTGARVNELCRHHNLMLVACLSPNLTFNNTQYVVGENRAADPNLEASWFSVLSMSTFAAWDYDQDDVIAEVQIPDDAAVRITTRRYGMLVDRMVMSAPMTKPMAVVRYLATLDPRSHEFIDRLADVIDYVAPAELAPHVRRLVDAYPMTLGSVPDGLKDHDTCYRAVERGVPLRYVPEYYRHYYLCRTALRHQGAVALDGIPPLVYNRLIHTGVIMRGQNGGLIINTPQLMRLM